MSVITHDFQGDIEAINRIPVIGSILEVICRTTGMGFAAVARVTEDRWVACSVRDEIQFGLIPGGELKLETTICHEIRQSGNGVIIDHVEFDPQFKHHHTPAMYGFQSYISLPIIRKDGTFFGTLCSIDPRPAKLNTPEIIGMFKLFADLISFHLNAVEHLSFTEALLAEEKKNTVLQEQLQLALQAAHIGTWTADFSTDLLTLSARARLIHGLAPDTVVTLTEALKMVVPEHRDRIAGAITWAVDTKGSFSEEYIIEPFDGSAKKWLRSSGKAYYDALGQSVSIAGTILDITEQKLEEQRKDDFLSIASHELKTPVTSLKAALQLLDRIKDDPNPAMQRRLIDQSNKSISKISALVEELLNTGRMSEGQLHLSKTNVNVAGLLNETCNHIRLDGKYNLVVDADSSLQVFADEHRIDQVLGNFIENALKYAPASPDIYLKAESLGDVIKVSVKDGGPGIPPDKLPHLFGRYYRADYSGSQYSGLGLGLYISAEIIKKHGGEIGVDSEIGKGSTFWFTLPLGVS